ncbi:TnsA-like heteromeric transposase endonuclease subunit [Microbacterium sp. P01]|uniref:TnsA-like heteromeric transposase endonuclease subunit n=1 Tax=Microbacterium sp. P01 TaxID=3366261 RepID=UPI00366C60A3
MSATGARYTLRTNDQKLVGGVLGELDARDVFSAEPRRTFRWHRGQRHYPGRYWAATMGSFVGYESRLELSALLLEDFDPRVVRIASQPFELIAERAGRPGSHVADFMVEYSDSSFAVIDVKPAQRLEKPEIADALGWAGDIIQSRGWKYRIVSEPDPVLLSNIRFLAGYRRSSQFEERDIRAVETAAHGARTLGEAFRRGSAAVGDSAYARTVVLHLLWNHVRSCDLTQPLAQHTALESP